MAGTKLGHDEKHKLKKKRVGPPDAIKTGGPVPPH
jgi:hypothetical protein